MDWIQQAVAEFGKTLDIDDLAFDPAGGLELVLDSGEIIGINYSPDLVFQEMLVFVAAPLVFDPLAQIEFALRACNVRYGDAPYLQAATAEQRLILALRLDARAFDLPALDQTVWRLVDVQQQAAAARQSA